MSAIRPLRVLVLAAALAALAGAVTSCQKGGAAGGAATDRIFGNGFRDNSPVLAKVGPYEITKNDFDRRYSELTEQQKRQYTGEGWERRFLRLMVNEALLYGEAQKRRLDRDPDVVQAMVSDRRFIMVNTLRQRELAKEAQPSEQDIRTYYERNRNAFTAQATIQARHVECRDQATAQAVYKAVRDARNPAWEFPRQVSLHSINTESAKQSGELGWFNRRAYIPALPNAQAFADVVFDWPVGLHAPVRIGDSWHVVEIQRREEQRPQTLDEVRDLIVQGLTPILQQQRIDEFLRQSRKASNIQYFGAYAPGNGLNPRDLIRLAQFAQTPEEKVELYKQVIDDFAESEYVDDALFLLSNVYLDAWGDIGYAGRYLDQLLREHPDSEFGEQARYILENMGTPNFRSPKTVEDLRAKAAG